MISIQQATQIVLNTGNKLSTEQIEFHTAVGRVLAQDVISDIPMPPFNKAAMDGFAIKEADIEKELEIVETIAAGQTPQKTILEGQAAKIMTGAPVPNGADFVIQVELSEQTNKNTVRFTSHPKNNIIPMAEDVQIGQVVLKKGQLITARHIAVMASVGCTTPEVYVQPKVGILSTGDEIVEPENTPKTSQIRNSNGHQLVAQVIECNGIANYMGIVSDTYEDTYNAIKEGMEQNDILLLTGGVSMGEFDFVPKIMKDLGIEIQFNRVAVQPGKPTTFGTKGNKVVFGLPGNPVSSYVQFELLVKPLLFTMLGIEEMPMEITLHMGEDFKRKKTERKAYLPVKVNEHGEVFTINYNGSAHIHALPFCNGLMSIEIGENCLNKGEKVNVRLF
jgi:molybdopterin molybdotransferase